MNKRRLPIPFLILILAGVVSLFSLVATGSSRTGMVRDNSLQMQMVEQERMAALYFRILSWLSDVTPRAAKPARVDPQPAAVPKVENTPQRHVHGASIELCTMHSVQNVATANLRARPIN